ncbi:MAG: endonuclease MutS2 [Chloroflexaceae bacterium]|nr:endonuclease MutS2 [Chloroflexaceae bacterium]
MTIAEATLETLEFTIIRQRLASYTSFAVSHQQALELIPSTEPDMVRQNLRLTTEARQLLAQYPDTTLGGARDIRLACQLADRGGILDAAALLDIASTLACMRRLALLLDRIDLDAFHLLGELLAALPSLPSLEDAIVSTLDDDGQIRDSASPKLRRIRQDMRSAAARLQERLQRMIMSSTIASALQEAIITVRDGRYVIPVKASHRRSVPGLVHDQSASGATLYIEPMAVVELNNQVREYQLAEEQEIARILAELSERVGESADRLLVGLDTLGRLDLALAQARYAEALRCVEPSVVATDQAESAASELLSLRQARHPLINQEHVVPIDIWLGGATQLLVITGPNTGGKTVALKTVGLLALMNQAGLHIPALEPSRLPVFGQVFADIGDEQSIEQSLSTFSSHMTRIIRILNVLDEPDQMPPFLVLLDELGAGTDPVEGSGLARAIIGRFLERGCLGLITTHYADLKAFAHQTPGVQNASVEFDIETLAPTYRLLIGLPGHSNALAIAARLGLDAELIDQARDSIAGEKVHLEDLLADIHREREAVAAAEQRAAELRRDAEVYRDRLMQEWQTLQEERESYRAAVQRDIDNEVREIRAELRRLRTEATRPSTTSRQWLQEAEERLQAARLPMQQRDVATTGDATPLVQPAPAPLQAGDSVEVRSVGLTGEILSIDEDDATADVQVGGFRMHVSLGELRRASGKAASTRQRRPVEERTIEIPPMPDVSLSFDMRGWRAADVQPELERYLNDAYMAGLGQVRLIHGKGSGVLRQTVRDILRKHTLISSFEGGGQDGGEGVTLARFVDR